MGAILIWLAETAIGAAIKGIWARFFPSKDEQLGDLKREIKENEMVIEAITDRAEVAEKRLDIANEPDPSVVDIADWLSGRKTTTTK